MPFFVEIEFSELEFFERLGSGAAGTVYRALWRARVVAVKKLLQLEIEVGAGGASCAAPYSSWIDAVKFVDVKL